MLETKTAQLIHNIGLLVKSIGFIWKTVVFKTPNVFLCTNNLLLKSCIIYAGTSFSFRSYEVVLERKTHFYCINYGVMINSYGTKNDFKPEKSSPILVF